MRRRLLLVFVAVLMGLTMGSAAGDPPDDGSPGNPGEHGGPRQGQCEDGIDNDQDGLTDADDPACQQPGCLPSSQTPKKCEEHTVNPPEGPEHGNCDDDIDNDGDGFTDEDDPDCQTGGGEEICDNLEDDDGDGAVDGADADCGGTETDCEDGVDNDGDGAIDYADSDCTTAENPDAGNCADGFDNDNDGLTDAEDPDCQTGGGEICDNGVDDDEDGAIDGADADCGGTETDCEDGVDNDGDGAIDYADSDCTTAENPDAGNCADGFDNDNDGLTDAEDPDCQTVGPTNLCTKAATDPGLLTEDTLGQTLWDGGLQLPPLTEDPERNGAISGPLSDALTDTPLEVVGDEAGCALDLLLDENTFPDL